MSRPFLEEVIEQILLRLPVKALLRFRCVSKSILDLIDNPYFMQTRNVKKLIIWKSYDESYAFDFDEGGVKGKVQLITPFKSPHNSWNNILGSSKGLILLFEDDDEKKLMLWNPFTKRYKQLTELKFQGFFHLDFGLGYDAASDDYKVVRVDSKSYEVWVYSLRLKSWLKFKDVPFVDFDGVSFVHCTSPSERYPTTLVALDFAKEKFQLLSLPMDFSKNPRVYVLDDGHLIWSEISTANPSLLAVDLFGGEKDGGAITWRKLASVSGERKFIFVKPLFYWEERGKILLDGDDYFIIFYDLEKKTCEYIPINGISSWKNSTTCLETLVSLGDDEDTATAAA